jgi:site-specific DNA-methyltransferase (adenine-specific)/modification methylase
MDINVIYNENCLDTLSKISDNTINIVITSPPYNMNLRIRNGKYCSREIVKGISNKYVGFNDNLPINDFYEFHSKVISELLRVSEIIFYNIQIVTGSKRAFFKIIGEYSDYLKDIVIWDKGIAQPAMAQNVLNRQSELLLIFDSKNSISRQFKQSNFKRGTLNDIWTIKRGKKIDKSHGAVFPEELVEVILKNFSKESDIVYDPFMGLGTTAIVAKRMNRKFIGSEIGENYFNIINDRIEK